MKMTKLSAPRVVIAALFFALLALLPTPTTRAQGPWCCGPRLYVVQYGDTLTSIAARFGVPLQTLMQANGYVPYYGMYVGRQVYLPYSAARNYSPMYAPPAYGQNYYNPYAPAAAPPANTAGTITYTVLPGDTLFSIARRFGVSVSDIMTLNNIYNPNLIFAYTTLRIPSASGSPPPTGYITYIVQYGDTLTRIALRFRTTVYAIVIANNIPNPNLIYAGQRLLIPTTAGVVTPTVTPTSTPAAAPTLATATPTPTSGGTVTATVTPTTSVTPTASSTATATSTFAVASPTSTATPTRTGTPAAGPIITPSVTWTPTPTMPPPSTQTPSPTLLPPTVTRTPTPLPPPTLTSTPTPTALPSSTATSSPTPSPSTTPTALATFTATATASPTGAANLVSMQNSAYNPNSLTVRVGATVAWRNDESSPIQHTVTSGIPNSPSGAFNSGIINPGQQYQFTFSTPGTFPYFCAIHGAAMTGTITVIP